MGAEGQLRDTGSAGHDTINTRVIPVVFVPGVMGSRLSIDNSPSWDPDNSKTMGRWVGTSTGEVRRRINFQTSANVLTGLDSSIFEVDPIEDMFNVKRVRDIGTKGVIHTDFTTKEIMKPFWEKRGWGGLAWSFYGAILMDLVVGLNPGKRQTSEIRPIYACGYDWRQSCGNSAKTLIACIDRALADHKAEQVVIVTHSMGGLVTRAALTQGATSKIAGVVHCVIPADGAVVAYRRFFTGATSALGETEFGLRNILGDSPEEYFEVQSGAQGPIELLPHDSYPDAWLFGNFGTNRTESDIFTRYADDFPPGLIQPTHPFANDVRARLRTARTFTRSVAGVFHPNTCLLRGNQTQTDMSFDWRRRPPPAPAPAPGTNPPSPAPPSGPPAPTPSGPPPPPHLDGENPVDADVCIPLADRSALGDETVPGPSAEFRACKSIASTPFNVTHSKCFLDKDFRKATIDNVKAILARA